MSASEKLYPEVQNKTLTDANTEYEIDISLGTKFLTFQCRTSFDVRFAFIIGKVATPTAPYMTLKSGMSYSVPEKFLISHDFVKLYLASAQAAVVVEYIAWLAQLANS